MCSGTLRRFFQNRGLYLTTKPSSTFLAKDSRPTPTDKKTPISWEQAVEEAKNGIRLRHYSLSTERTYLGWIARFKTYVRDREPNLLEPDDVKKYLTHLALHGRVSASTQNQAFNALLFLYRHILHMETDETLWITKESIIEKTCSSKKSPLTPILFT